MSTKEDIIEVIKTVIDPDLFIDIYTLGLIYEVQKDGEKVNIKMTFTTPACPSGPMLIEEVRMRVRELEDVEEVNVEIVFEPPWEPSEELKEMMGIA